MSRRKATGKTATQSQGSVTVENSSVDPILASLFASSLGPVVASVKRTRSSIKVSEKTTPVSSAVAEGENEIESTSSSDMSTSEDEIDKIAPHPRKRRRLSDTDDLESTYLDRLVREEQKEISERLKGRGENAGAKLEEAGDDSDSSASNDLEDLSDLEPEDSHPLHESLTQSSTEYEKTRRTVFLSNVSTEAIRSKSSRRQLETHLKSVLDADAKETVESIRFRSTAFNVAAGPRKAAYAKKELMDETTKSTNAYAVFSTEGAAKKVAKKLNGIIVLDRHLHTDWLAHPTAVDYKRCVFVGNLNFVNLESNVDTNQEGEKQKHRSRSKEPADAEEGLWRTFSKCGPVESVRVIRDKATRVGKGFAYVQFSDGIAVEKALALDGKKFPPMLPRLLRVSRAKKLDKKTKRQQDSEKPKSKSARPDTDRSQGPGKPKLNGIVFEGYRASAAKGMKFKTKTKTKKLGSASRSSRSSKRGAAFKAGGGKKKRDMK